MARYRCKVHYDRAYHRGEFVVRRINPGACTIAGCERKKVGHGLCAAHWIKWRRHGDPLTPHRVNHYDPEEMRRLNDHLDSIPLGKQAAHGEVAYLALILGRTKTALHGKLHKMRRDLTHSDIQ